MRKTSHAICRLLCASIDCLYVDGYLLKETLDAHRAPRAIDEYSTTLPILYEQICMK